MRVLHLATTYPLHPRDSNAAFVQSIAEGLAARGHEIEVLLPWHPELELDRPGTRVKLRSFQYTPTRHWHPWGYAQALRADRELRRDAYLAAIPAAISSWASIRRALRREKWDLVHAHWLLPNAPIMAAARGNDGPPLVISCHGSGVFLAERSRWTAAAARYAMDRASAVTACSGDLCRRLEALGGGPAPQRIPYGVDTDRFRPMTGADRLVARTRIAAEYDVPDDGAWIVAVGRLVYKKGFDVLIRALPRILETVPATRCLFAGSGPLEAELRAAAEAEGVAGRVHFLGPVPHAIIPELYSVADVMAVPSVHGPGGNVDGLPNVLMESLATGAAIVASRVAGIPDVVRDGHNGLLFEEGDAAGLAAAALRALTDADLARRIGAQARTGTVAELRWERVCEQFEAVYGGRGRMSLRLDLVFPRFKILSGAERLILSLAAGLVRAGHRPRIVCHRFDESCRPLLDPGATLVTTGLRLDWTGNRYVNAAFDYARAGALHGQIDPEADAAILYGPALRLAPRLTRRRPPRPAVVYHCFEPPRVLYQDGDDVLARAGLARGPLRLMLAAYRRLDRRLVSVAEAVTASGPYAARRVLDVYGREAIPITHGIDRARLDAPSGAVLPPADLITVNYLHPRKRVDRVIRALAALPAELGGTVLEIVGDGPERASLEALARELGVADRVRFAGFVDEARLADHYRRAACYVHAAREESFGLSVIEAAYCGLPVVAVAEGGVVDNVVDGETGHLTGAVPGAIAGSIANVLLRPDRGVAMGLRGRERVDRYYRWERGAQDLLSAVEQARALRSQDQT